MKLPLLLDPRVTVAIHVALIALLMLGAGAVGYVKARFWIAVDPQLATCLPGNHHYLLIDRTDRTIERGGLYAFRAKGLEPLFPDDTLMAKLALALPGDRVRISHASTSVNDEVVATGLDVAEAKHWPEVKFIRTETVAPSSVWFFGKTGLSFDSRYFGGVAEQLIVGRAYVLF